MENVQFVRSHRREGNRLVPVMILLATGVVVFSIVGAMAIWQSNILV